MQNSRIFEADLNCPRGQSSNGFKNSIPENANLKNSVCILNHKNENSLSLFDLFTIKGNLHENIHCDENTSSVYNCTNVTKSFATSQETSVPDIQNFTPDCSLVPLNHPFSLFSNDSFGKNPNSSFIKDFSSDNLPANFVKDSSRNLLPKSPLEFTCLNCGLGFPCTLFVCRRTNLSNNAQKSQVIDNNLEAENFENSSLHVFSSHKTKLSTNEYLPENNYKFLYRKTTTDTYETISNSLLAEQNSYFISNKEKSPAKYKMQCKNDLKELNQDCKLSRNTANVSVSEDASASNTQNVLKVQNDDYNSASKLSPFRNLFSPSKISNLEEQSTDLPIESLSQGTRNFLIELAASKATKTSSESGYALSTINSPFSRKKKKDEIVADSNKNKASPECVDVSVSNYVNVSTSNDIGITAVKDDDSLSNNKELSFLNEDCVDVTNINVSDTKNVTILNDQVVSVLDDDAHVETEEKISKSDNITDSKDVVSALDLIEQSTLHDREMSSAEICNSLNQIFSEANVVFSTTADSNSEVCQAAGTGVDYETITLQTVDSNNENVTNVETSTINLADLCLAENSELYQQILLVQDESGNIETVLLLPQNAQVVENVPSYEGNSSESLLLVNNVGENIGQETEIQEEECISVNSVSTDKVPDHIENVLTMCDPPDNGESVLTLDSLSEQQHKSDLKDCSIKKEALSPQKNLRTDNVSLEIKEAEEKRVHQKESFDHHAESVLTDQKINSVNVPSSDKSTTIKTEKEAGENKILSQNQVLDYTQNGKEFFIKYSENSISSGIDVQSMINTNLKYGHEEFSSATNKFNSNNVSLLKQSSNKANNSFKSLKEQENKSAHSSVDTNYIDTLKFSENKDKFLVNSVANISDSSLLTSVRFPSKAKKRFSFNGTNSIKPVQFSQYIQPSLNNAQSLKVRDTSTPLNGAVYLSQSNSPVQKHQSYNSSNVKQFIESKIFKKNSIQKSKKTIVHKLNNRTAKKTVSVSKENSDLPQINHLLKNTDSESFIELLENKEIYIRAKNILLKRGLEEDVIDCLLKRKKNSHFGNTLNDEVQLIGVSESKTRTVALKTFIKPFTAAKKSVFDSRMKSKNTALKTCMSRNPSLKNTALKSFSHKLTSEKPKQVGFKGNFLKSSFENQTSIQNNQRLPENYFQPEICEIRILPNEYVKRASDVLLKTNSVECPNTSEEIVSEEELKMPLQCSSPMEELMLPRVHCVCTEKEIPCLCYDNSLQRICEAEDTIDDKVVPCTNHVSQHYLHTPSSEIKHQAFCDIHLSRLRQHHCCPKCGIFCSQGDFLLCSYEDLESKENHLFHTSCFIIPSTGLPPGCPHCCQFSNFNTVNLIYKSALNQEQKEVPSNAQNITSEIDDCDVFMSVKQDVTPNQSFDSDAYVPQKNMTQLMIRSLAKQNSFRLRPTAKCLHNPIKTGDVQKVMQLIGNGVNPNHKFRMHGNNAPLHVAASYCQTGILHILLQAGAYIDAVNDDLETPLIVAVEKNNLPIVRYLVFAGAQIDVKDCNGMTSFHIASKNGFKEIAEFLYNTGNIDINLQDNGGWTALVWACEYKHEEFVRWLLEIGADPNVRDNEGNTVLHWAAYSGKYEIAELLLDKGCTLSYVNKRGDSVLHIAAREDNYDCVRLFINRGAVLDHRNKENKTPLMCCEADSLSYNHLCQSISSGALKNGKLQLENHVVFRDISRGAEAYPIQAINEVDDEEFIMEFRYVVKHCHRSGVNIISTVDSMQFCYCKDNCVTRDCNCTLNSKCWYDANGCLTSEYDLKSSPVIYECNKTCHCPKTCINRVVQQGLRFPLQIFRTRYKGWGVRALQDIPKGAFVCEYVGELITGTEATQRNDDTYLFDLESQGSDYCLDGRYFGNVARFLNHSCEPNLIALKVFVDHQDMNFPRIAFFAYKEIQAFEELCFDYGLDFWIVKCQTILCVCNTQSCKYSKDAIDDTLWRFFMDTDNGEQLNCAS